jgi:hypothetical protein
MNRLAYRLTGMMNRWSNATPTACCGACKPCITEAATNLVVVAAGVGLEVAGGRRGSGGEGPDAQPGERPDEPRIARFPIKDS